MVMNPIHRILVKDHLQKNKSNGFGFPSLTPQQLTDGSLSLGVTYVSQP